MLPGSKQRSICIGNRLFLLLLIIIIYIGITAQFMARLYSVVVVRLTLDLFDLKSFELKSWDMRWPSFKRGFASPSSLHFLGNGDTNVI